MSTAELLRQATAAGLTVRLEDQRVVVRGPRCAEEWARRLLACKAELLPLLPQQAGTQQVASDPPPASATAVGPSVLAQPGANWREGDQAEADRLLAELHARLAQIEREHYGGQFPSMLRGAIDVCLEVVASHVQAQDLEMLSGDLSWLLSVARGDRWKGHQPPWERKDE